jgi:hypothetical protein
MASLFAPLSLSFLSSMLPSAFVIIPINITYDIHWSQRYIGVFVFNCIVRILLLSYRQRLPHS